MPVRKFTHLHRSTHDGPLCFFHAHNIGSRDDQIPRYDETEACVRCCSALLEGRLTIDVHRIDRRWRRRFLEFWSFVRITGPADCWTWQGRKRSNGKGVVVWSRHWASRSNNFSPSRAAFWLSWGDIGRLPITHTCGNPDCCNPLHLRVQGIPQYTRFTNTFKLDLEFHSKKLVTETQEYLETAHDRNMERFEILRSYNPEWIDYRVDDEGYLADKLDEELGPVLQEGGSTPED